MDECYFSKGNTPPWVFHFLIYANGTKSCKAPCINDQMTFQNFIKMQD